MKLHVVSSHEQLLREKAEEEAAAQAAPRQSRSGLSKVASALCC